MNTYENELKNIHQNHNIKTLYRSIVFALLTASLLILAGCPASEKAEDVGGITAQQIIENPDAYVGKTVKVSGDVEEIHGPKAFNMDSGLSIGELLVVGREPFPNIPDADGNAYLVSSIATVTGTVQRFVVADIEREIGWDLSPEIEAEFESKPVLIAQQVQFQPAKGAVAADNSTVTNKNTEISANDKDGTKSNTNGKIVDLAVYSNMSENDKMSLAGRAGEFSDVRVNRIVGPKTFTIGSGSNELYVMLDDDAAKGVGTQGKIGIGDKVNISGQFSRLESEEVMNVADRRFRNLTDQERSFMKDKKLYLDVNQIKILE